MSPACRAVLDRIESADLPCYLDTPLECVNTKAPNFGETPLHIIAVWGDIDAARILLDEGAEIDAPGEHDFTPLHEAISQGHVDLVKLLITRGASLTQKNEWDMDARELAAIHESPEMRELLNPR